MKGVFVATLIGTLVALAVAPLVRRMGVPV